MKHLKHYLLTAFIAIPLAAGAQNPTGATGTAPGQGATTPNTSKAGAPMASSSAIKIVSPKSGEKVASSAISVQYELLNDAISAAGSPTYRLQLDSRDPVETTGTDYSFSGLRPGKHVLTVEVVDANHTPIMGSRTQVQFTTADQMPAASANQQVPPSQQQAPHPGQQTTPQQQQTQPPTQQQAQPQQQSPRAELVPPSVTKASLPLPDSGVGELPSAAGELPMLSMVGFGVLIGGVISAMRTRR